MIRAPRTTLSGVIERPRSLDLAVLILAIAATCSVGFLMTRVGRIAALDQEVRQLESLGTIVTDARYAELRQLQPYLPLISAVSIVVGWPIAWMLLAFGVRAIGNRGSTQATYAQVLAVVVHASAIFALRAIVAEPINYARESIGGATSLSVLLPGLGESTFVARLFGALDLFVLWWVVVLAMGFAMLYRTRALPVARWLFGAYATGAAALALTQALRGGI